MKRKVPILDSAASPQWVVRLMGDASAVTQALGLLRLHSGILVAPDDNSVWIRGQSIDADLDWRLRALPNAERFSVAADGELTAWNSSVPSARLPNLRWQPIQQWLQVGMRPAAFAASPGQQIHLQLVRSDAVMAANLIRVSWPVWRDYALTAPQIRLNQWSFAVSDSMEVLVRGTPLPSLPGERFVEACGIAIPAGWKTEPAIDRASLWSILSLQEGDLALLQATGIVEVISESAFVRATRSAVRLTEQQAFPGNQELTSHDR